jgi:hypothetical protein
MSEGKIDLTKKEKALMWVVYRNVNKEGVCFRKPVDLLRLIPYKIEFRADELDGVLKALELDDYLDYVEADHRGEKVYCITMHTNGFNFARTEADKKRKLILKISLTVATAALAAIVKFIVNAIVG